MQIDAQKWAPGIEIISIRVIKPNIPEKLKQQYEDLAIVQNAAENDVKLKLISAKGTVELKKIEA